MVFVHLGTGFECGAYSLNNDYEKYILSARGAAVNNTVGTTVYRHKKDKKMSRSDVLDDLIRNLDPEDVPIEFIVMAKVTDFDGNERIVRGEELEAVIRDPDLQQVAEIRVIYNVKKMRRAMTDEVSAVYDEVARLLQQKIK